MSISKQDRLRDLEAALDLIFLHVGLQWFRSTIFDSRDTPFASIVSTTWCELLDTYHYVERPKGFSNHFRLTARGWLHEMERNRALESAEFQKMLGAICAALKDRVKGRRQGAVVEVNAVERETDISHGMICNIVDANVIERILKRYGATWLPKFDGKLVFVPITFGLGLL